MHGRYAKSEPEESFDCVDDDGGMREYACNLSLKKVDPSPLQRYDRHKFDANDTAQDCTLFS